MKRTIAFLMSLIMVLSVTVFCDSGIIADAVSKQELESRIDELDEQIKQNKEKLNDLAKQKEKQQEYLDTLQSQISAAEEKASALESKINDLDTEIDGYNAEIKKLNTEIATIQKDITKANNDIKETENNIALSKDELALKLRTAYVNGKQSTLKILMGSTSLANFLTRLEMMKRTSEDEKRVIDNFNAQAKKLKAAKQKLVESKQKLDEAKAAIEATKQKAVDKKLELRQDQNEYKSTINSLEANYAQIESFIDALDKNSAVYNNYIGQLQQQKQEADAEMDRIIAEYEERKRQQQAQQQTTVKTGTNSEGSSSGSSNKVYQSNDTWAWPVGNASCYISSGFGYRDASISGWGYHGGIDISGSGFYGTPIYATRGGTVITAAYTETGYGHYVMIDHGDGFISIYGHCSTLYVSTGQTVSKGQHIANAGSTGNSTGPHLHFEIRYNGEKVNPLNYVSR